MRAAGAMGLVRSSTVIAATDRAAEPLWPIPPGHTTGTGSKGLRHEGGGGSSVMGKLVHEFPGQFPRRDRCEPGPRSIAVPLVVLFWIGPNGRTR